MSGWRRAMAYLGLVDEVDETDEPRGGVQAARPRQPTVRLAADEPVPGAEEIDLRERSSVATAPRQQPAAQPPRSAQPVQETARLEFPADGGRGEPDNVRPLRPVGRAGNSRRPRRPETASHVAVVAVDQFDAVEAVAVRLREREAVVLDLSSADKTTARRVLDFVSGAVFVVDASLQPLGNRAFLVVPQGVEVSSNERRRLTNLGYRVEPDRIGGLG